MGSADDILGREHPLARAAQRARALRLQVGVAVVAGGVALVAWAAGWRWAGALALAAVCAVVAFGIALLIARQDARDHALDAIIGGRHGLEVREVVGVSRSLGERRYRRSLARSLERTLELSRRWWQLPPGQRPPGDVRHLPQVAGELCEVVALLRAESAPSVRGVALCERLLSDGPGSPLYGGQPEALRRELGRIRYELERAA
jgi:hypothetical protein